MDFASTNCLEPDQAIAFVAGELDTGQRGAVQRHLYACPTCSELLAHLVRSPLGLRAASDRAPLRSIDPAHGEPARSLVAGERVGRYEITQERGRGGMGVVYEALDVELRRTVAIKLVRPGSEGSEGRGRLLREARSLARVSHRNIVEVFDVGEHEEQVFVAMELVDGQTLGDWAQGRPGGEVLAAYLQAGEGLAAAHERGLVHRDFKPSNAIVTPLGRVVVLDFGLAYVGTGGAVSVQGAPQPPSLDDDSFVTHSHVVLGTPAYMSPEQRWGRVTDARSDQYSFCVALYEALWSVHPFRDKGSRLDAPPVPARAVYPQGWPAVRRGLALEPADRYPNMSALLQDLPQTSGPRRRRAYLGATVAVALIAVVAMGSLDGETVDCERSGQRLTWSAAETERITTAFESTDLPHADVATAQILGSLDAFAQSWRTEAESACRGRVHHSAVVADYRSLCLENARVRFQVATDVLTRADRSTVNAVDAIAEQLGAPSDCASSPEHLESAVVIALGQSISISTTMFDGGRVDEAMQRVRAVQSELQQTPDSAEHAHTLVEIGRLLHKAGRLDEAKEQLRAAAWMADAIGADRPSAEAWTELGWVYGYESVDLELAREALRHATASIERLGGDAALRGIVDRTSGWVEMNAGDPVTAEIHFRAGLARIDTDSRDGHMLAIDLGAALQGQGRYEDAASVLEDVSAKMEHARGREHPDLAAALNNLGGSYRGLERFDEALALYERIVEIYHANYGDSHVDTGRVRINLGIMLADHDRWEEALRQYELAAEAFIEHLGQGHAAMAWVHDGRGGALYGMERYEDATAEFERAIAIKVETLGPDHPRLAETYANLGIMALEQGDHERSVEQLAKSDVIMRNGLSETYPQRGYVRNAMGDALLALGRREEAREMYAWVAALETVKGTRIEAEAVEKLEALSG